MFFFVVFFLVLICNYHSIKLKLSDVQVEKLKSATKKLTGIALTLSSDKIGTDKINFLHNLLFTNRQFEGLHKDFGNNSSKDIKLIKSWLSKIIQLGRFFGRRLGPFLKVGCHSWSMYC